MLYKKDTLQLWDVKCQPRFTDLEISEMSAVICFPHTSASGEIGRQALQCCFDVILYMPKEIDQKWGKHVLTDLTTLAARSGQNSVSCALSADFSSPAVKVVFFPNLGEEKKIYALDL